MTTKPRLLRITTVPVSLKLLLRGQLRFMQSSGFEVLAVSADGKETEDIVKEGVPHLIVRMTRKITPFADLLALFQLIRIMRTFKPQIVHTHTPKAGLLGMIAAWISRVPVRLHTVAGLPLMESAGNKRKLLILTEKVTYSCATHVYTNSKGLFSFIRANISQTAGMNMIGKGSTNGIDSEYFQRTGEIVDAAASLRKQLNISPDEIVFSFVGRIVKDKGISEFIHAFRKLTGDHPERQFRMMLIGDFEIDLDPLTEADMNFLKTDPSVILAGFQPDVRPWLTASDIFIFPSYREGFPNVVLQACCLEVPCIVSDINGCNEIIQHRSTGLVVPPKDHEALYQAMAALSEDTIAREAFALQARRFVVENFEQQYVWDCLLQEYKRHLTALRS